MTKKKVRKKKGPKLERRISLKLEDTLFERIEDLAETELRSLNNQIRLLLWEAIYIREGEKK